MKKKNAKGPRYYFAYGANMNLRAMKHRCPKARLIGPATIEGFKLVFRGVADIEEDPKGKVLGALWILEPSDERNLDAFEGYPFHYIKRDVRVNVNGSGARVWAMAYIMRSQGLSRLGQYAPMEHYAKGILEGYQAMGHNTKPLIASIAASIRSADGRAKR